MSQCEDQSMQHHEEPLLDYERSNEDSDVHEESDTDNEVWNTELEKEIEADVGLLPSDHAPPLPIPFPESESTSKIKAILMWLVRFILLFQTKFYISDSAIECLLKFMQKFLQVLGYFSDHIASLAKQVPSSTYQLKQQAQFKNEFRKYVVCHSIYDSLDCFTTVGSTRMSKLCMFTEFPNHPHARLRQQCSQQFLKTVEFMSRKQILYPFKVYCYNPLILALRELFNRPSFYESCCEWKSRERKECLEDIYDGKLWEDFLTVNGEPFLIGQLGLGLILNVDWFQPYKHVACSVDVVFISVMMNVNV